MVCSQGYLQVFKDLGGILDLFLLLKISEFANVKMLNVNVFMFTSCFPLTLRGTPPWS